MIYYYFYNPKIELAGIGALVDFDSKNIESFNAENIQSNTAIVRESFTATAKKVFRAKEIFSFKRSNRK